MFTNDIALTVVVTTLLILLLIAVVIITMILANRKHVAQEVKMTQMQLDYEKELRTVEQEVQEQTLTNVARELHDNIGQLLTLMRIHLETQKLDGEEAKQKLAPIDDTLNDTIDQVRMLSHSLNTDHIATKGLLYVLDREAERLSKLNRMQIKWQNDGVDVDWDKGRKIMVFRMFQEIINNILKHAAAQHIIISMKCATGFELKIEDDGAGFDKEEVLNNNNGTGLQNLLKRAKLAGVSLDINSEKGEGSTFTIRAEKDGQGS